MENMNIKNIKGKHVLVVGLGKSGIAAVQAMLKLGAEVSVQDSKSPDQVDGQLINFLTGSLGGENLGLYLGTVPEDMSQFCLSSVTAGSDGTLYYKNDSGNIFAVSESTQSPFIKLMNTVLRILLKLALVFAQ